MNSYGFHLKGSWKNMAISLLLILLPMALIVMQKETGSALVYTSLVLMLYREGMPGFILFLGISAVTYVVVGLRFSEDPALWGLVSMGDVLVGLLILGFRCHSLLRLLPSHGHPRCHEREPQRHLP